MTNAKSLAEKQTELFLLKDQNSNLINQAQDYAKLSEQYNNILSSKSWRLTMPLRLLMFYIRKICDR